MKKLLSLAGAALILSSGLVADTTPDMTSNATPTASSTPAAKHMKKTKHKRSKRPKKTKTPTPVAGETAK
jgi:hypothetical protein